MKKCFGYVRVSTVKQGEGVSLEAQKEAILHYASRNEIEIVKWFEEKVTAAKSGRPLFTQMLRDLKNGKAKGLVIHKIDRSARNFADWAKIGDLSDTGVDIHFASESLDFRSRGGRLTADIQAVIASDYIRNLREETIKGIRGRLKQGLYPFGAPIGYLDMGGGKRKEIDVKRAQLVKEMFRLYATGEYPIRRLVRKMETLGLETKTGRILSTTGIEKILSNPFYTGIMKIKTTGEIYKGIHEPIINADIFEAVQAVKTGKSRKIITRHSCVFRGLFRCALCKTAMIPELQKGHTYYRCHTKLCETKTIREEIIEDASSNIFKGVSFDDQKIEKITSTICGWNGTSKGRMEVAGLRKQIQRQDERLENLTTKLIDNIIDDVTFQKTKEKILFETVSLEQKRQGILDLDANVQKLKLFLERAKNLYFQYIYSNDDEKRRLLKMFTSNRLVSRKKIGLDLQNWFGCLASDAFANSSPPPRLTYRTSHLSQNSEVLDFQEIMKHINEFSE